MITELCVEASLGGSISGRFVIILEDWIFSFWMIGRKRSNRMANLDGIMETNVFINSNNKQIELNVGGTIFTTSISTLTGYSSYFKAKFSQEWFHDASLRSEENENVEYDNKKPIQVFLDQNPEPFRILLEFMRSGCISSDDVCKTQVLIQAEYLGIHDLLCAVKYRAYRNKHPEVYASPQDVIQLYDSKYGGAIKHSIAQGILPKYIMQREVRKEYALLGKSAGRFLVQVPKCLFEEKKTEEEIANDNLSAESGSVPLCPLFLDCLNWLGMHGFTTLDIPECVVLEGIRRIFFSRHLVADVLECEENSYYNSLIIDQEHDKPKLYPTGLKQYAQLTVETRSIVPNVGGLGMFREVAKIEADLGKVRHILVGGEEFNSRISKVVGINEATTVSCINWLQRNGYTTREPDLEAFYRDTHIPSPDHRTVSIFSRTLIKK